MVEGFVPTSSVIAHGALAEDGEASEAEQERLEHRTILGGVIKAQRQAVAELRGRGSIDDGVLRAMERELDLEELRLSAETRPHAPRPHPQGMGPRGTTFG